MLMIKIRLFISSCTTNIAGIVSRHAYCRRLPEILKFLLLTQVILIIPDLQLRIKKNQFAQFRLQIITKSSRINNLPYFIYLVLFKINSRV